MVVATVGIRGVLLDLTGEVEAAAAFARHLYNDRLDVESIRSVRHLQESGHLYYYCSAGKIDLLIAFEDDDAVFDDLSGAPRRALYADPSDFGSQVRSVGGEVDDGLLFVFCDALPIEQHNPVLNEAVNGAIGRVVALQVRHSPDREANLALDSHLSGNIAEVELVRQVGYLERDAYVCELPATCDLNALVALCHDLSILDYSPWNGISKAFGLDRVNLRPQVSFILDKILELSFLEQDSGLLTVGRDRVADCILHSAKTLA